MNDSEPYETLAAVKAAGVKQILQGRMGNWDWKSWDIRGTMCTNEDIKKLGKYGKDRSKTWIIGK